MYTKLRDGVIIVGCLVLFGVGGPLLEHTLRLDPGRLSIRTEAGPAGTSAGRLGRIARQLEIDARAVNSLLMAPEALPSSLVIDVRNLDPGWPVLSIVADAADLNDPENGILANPHERGREWERLAFASYYVQRELVFATRVGLRRHGGASRGHPGRPSLRLYFRDEYDSELSGQAVLEEIETAPARIVVRRSAPFLATTMAFEIARRIGAPTPDFKLAQLYLNGKLEGPYLLTEHVHLDGWGRSYFGHKQLSMLISRGTVPTDETSSAKFAELDIWARGLPKPLTMKALEANVDLDNMSRNVFTFFYCGTGDWAQGAVVRDESRDDSRWFWLHWDLDQSFRERSEMVVNKPILHQMINPVPRSARSDLRTTLFRRLLEEDPSFKGHFVRLAMDLLNHRLVPGFFNGLLNRYDFALSRREMRAYMQFFEMRADVVRAEMQMYLGAGPAHRVFVKAPDGFELEIDGHGEEGGYEGAYFEGSEITLELTGVRSPGSFYWLVNGERRDGRRLVHTIEQMTTIDAVLDR